MMGWITPSSSEWDRMWMALERATGDMADYCPRTGESWQYMGTVDRRHQFRHRNRPFTAQFIEGSGHGRVYLHLDAETLNVVYVNATPYDDVPAKQAALFSKRGLPGQRNLFADRGVPDDMVGYTRREEYSGAFDGFSVTSDADPGL